MEGASASSIVSLTVAPLTRPRGAKRRSRSPAPLEGTPGLRRLRRPGYSRLVITVTDVARNKILVLLAKEQRPDLALRLAVDGRGPGGYRYRLGFVQGSEQAPADLAVDAGGFKLLIDPES